MLTINVRQQEMFNDKTNEFSFVGVDKTIELEHSLVAISKWESIWKKPFLTKNEKSLEETHNYIRCMILGNDLMDVECYNSLTGKQLNIIMDYIDDSKTATTFNTPQDKSNNRDVITSELIYYWMITLNIPFECQYWHLNRLLTLIKVINIKNAPQKTMSASEIMRRNHDLNAERKRQLNSKG